MVAVRLSDGSTIDATDRNPFWVESRGEWVDAIDLKSGDVVVAADSGRLTVASLSISEQDLTAYNLTVDGLHTYYVGDHEMLVHNAGPDRCRITSSVTSPAKTSNSWYFKGGRVDIENLVPGGGLLHQQWVDGLVRGHEAGLEIVSIDRGG